MMYSVSKKTREQVKNMFAMISAELWKKGLHQATFVNAVFDCNDIKLSHNGGLIVDNGRINVELRDVEIVAYGTQKTLNNSNFNIFAP